MKKFCDVFDSKTNKEDMMMLRRYWGMITKCVVAFSSIFILTSQASAYLTNWYTDLDMDADLTDSQAFQWSETLNVAYGRAFVVNENYAFPNDLIADFNEVAFYNTNLGVDTNGDNIADEFYQLSSIFVGEGTTDLANGSATFSSGSLEIYLEKIPSSDSNGYFYDTQQANNKNPSADNTDNVYNGVNNTSATLVGQFDLVHGEGVIDTSGVPNGQFTLTFEAEFLAQHFWYDESGNDLSEINPVQFVFGFFTSNPSSVDNEHSYILSELISDFYQDEFGSISFNPNDKDTWSNAPSRLLLDNNGQWRLEVVPEPVTMFLFGTGLIGLAGFRKKWR